MKPSAVFAQHRDTIRRLVAEHGMANPRLFGSVLHGDDIDGSDLDILIDAPPGTSLFDVIGLHLDLEAAVGIKVDLLTSNALPPKFRERVVSEAQPI